LKRQEDGQAFLLASSNLKVRIDKQTGAVSFLNPAGGVLLQESPQGRRIQPATLAGAAVTSAAQSFETGLEEGIYGLGQHQRGAWNYSGGNGGSVRLAQSNMDVGVAVATSSKGYMLLWDNAAVTTISTGAAGESSHRTMRPCGGRPNLAGPLTTTSATAMERLEPP
jgi:alpha-D-xyloside xylohydrolase